MPAPINYCGRPEREARSRRRGIWQGSRSSFVASREEEKRLDYWRCVSELFPKVLSITGVFLQKCESCGSATTHLNLSHTFRSNSAHCAKAGTPSPPTDIFIGVEMVISVMVTKADCTLGAVGEFRATLGGRPVLAVWDALRSCWLHFDLFFSV